MNLQIAVLLGQDGITNGAIYALLALSIVLVFAVTRVLLIPLGEYVAFGALTMAALQAGQRSAVVWLLAGLCALAAVMDLLRWRRDPAQRPGLGFALKIVYPLLLLAAIYLLPLATLPMAVQILLTLALLVPMGPLLYRIVYQPIADAPVLVLLIVSIALHIALVGIGLLVFGAEGGRTTPLADTVFELDLLHEGLRLQAQTLVVLAASLLLIVLLYLLFDRTLVGKALRAAAMNRVGARLMGISPVFAGQATFALASLIGTLSGVLIAPLTTIYFDSGFMISLKGFVGAIVGGLVSYPLAAAGALLVGLIESYSTFWSSAHKEIIVFTLIIPVLLWRSLTSRHVEDEE